jgi:TldD protein
MKELSEVGSSIYLDEIRPVLLKLGKRLGEEYSYYSILATDNSSRTYTASAGGVSATANPLHTSRGIVIRVRDEKGFAEYSLSQISDESIDDVLDTVREKIIGMRDGLEEFAGNMSRGRIEEEELSFVKNTTYKIHPDEYGDGKIIDVISGIREEGLSMSPKLIDCGISVTYQEIHKLFLSARRDLTQNLVWTVGAVSVMAKRWQEVKTVYTSVSGLGGLEIIDGIKEKLGYLVETVEALLESQPMIPGTYDCICTPDVTGMIVHEAFGHGVEMDRFVKDRALAKDHIGKQVASELVTMHDGGIAAYETGSYFFDDEGVEARDTVIIEKGILKRGISDDLSALSLGTPPTGNGRRQDFGAKAYTRMTNTFFEGGSDDVDDMIASIKYGFLLENPTSGMEDPKNWGIQCMVSHAREIADGKLTGKIYSPVVLTGYVPDLLRSITMMSRNVEFSGGGMCGKGYKEWVFVSDGGPHMKARAKLG